MENPEISKITTDVFSLLFSAFGLASSPEGREAALKVRNQSGVMMRDTATEGPSHLLCRASQGIEAGVPRRYGQFLR